MAPITQASDETNHQALMEKLDIFNIHKPFKRSTWKAPQRRNKSVRQIVAEASKKESASGTATPMEDVKPLEQTTYTNIESAPSMNPSSQRHYCDITGLPAPYTDPKTRLRYHNKEIFGVVRNLAQGSTDGYLSARGAQVILK